MAEPQNADFIARVVSDAKNPPETRMLTGWFGDSGEEGYRRLYTDPELNNYVDIPDDAILYSEPLRDSQPAGCVMVWVKRDAALKPGGSAASRAARFLQGQVTADFSAGGGAANIAAEPIPPEKAGFRCVTQVPCGEVTGFTGQCTKQPDVGGAWPCITAIPHCFEPTGFTGKCTPAPWPNPTHYIGCTFLHCPTRDLTHIPHICNIIATGQPGCVVVNPPQGGDPAQKKEGAAEAADAEQAALPATHIPGCGYTKTWGLCPTHPPKCQVSVDIPCIPRTEVGCQPTRACPEAAFITSICAPTGFCRVTQHCQAAAAETWTSDCTRAHPPICYPTEACHTQAPQCPAGAQNFAAAAPNPVVATPALPCVSAGVHGCTVPPTSPDFKCTQFGPACTQSGPQCPSKPVTACTQSGPQCPTSCGPDCQSQQPGCTSIGEICGHKLCPTNDIGFECTQACPTIPAMGCPVTNPQVICAQPQAAIGRGFTPLQPTPATHCFVCPPFDANPINAQAFAAAPQAIGTSQVGCPASDFVACSQFGGCPTIPKGDCTFFGCPSLQQAAAAGPGIGCTQSGPLCPTHAKPQCTFFGPACPPTPATVCTQFAPCRTHQWPHCPTQQFECTMFCTQGAPGCPPSIQSPACVAPQQAGVRAAAFDQSTDFCPTSLGCGGAAHPQAAMGGFTPLQPTPATHCRICNPAFDFAAQAQPQRQFQTVFVDCITQPTPATHCFVCPPFDAVAQAQARPIQTHFFQCINHPTPATRCFICPPFDAAAAAAPAALATGPGYGCTYVGPNCPHPTQVAGCGATQQQHCTPVCGFDAVAAPGGFPTPATRCFICPQEQINTFWPCTSVGCVTVSGPRCFIIR